MRIFNFKTTWSEFHYLPRVGPKQLCALAHLGCISRYKELHCQFLFQDIAVKVTNSLVNIKAITAHFNPKIEAWLAAQQLSTPTEDQILEVVKSNYDSLTLKLQVFFVLFFCEVVVPKKIFILLR